MRFNEQRRSKVFTRPAAIQSSRSGSRCWALRSAEVARCAIGQPHLIGILLLSPMPVLLALLDVVERGGVVEYGGVKIDFFHRREKAMLGIIIAPNIGLQRQPVTDNSTMQMLEALRQSTTCDVVIIDLEDGRALWESRLLVLLTGAIRIGKPDKIVFVAKDASVDRRFRGWSDPGELLPRILNSRPQYGRSLQSWAASAQWNLVGPPDASAPAPQVWQCRYLRPGSSESLRRDVNGWLSRPPPVRAISHSRSRFFKTI